MKLSSFLSSLRFLVPLLLSLPAVALLGREGYFFSHDGLHHLYRLVGLDAALRDGEVYPRILPDLLFGYGYPVLDFYSPLGYYVGELWHLLGLGFIDSIELTFAAGFVFSALTMYLFARELFGELGAVVAAGVYTYLPYRMADTYVRGALGEALAFVFFPLVLWALHRLILRRQWVYALALGLSLALLILTHNLSMLMLAPFAAAYALLLAAKERSLAVLIPVVASVVLAAGATAFYWLPSLAESSLVAMGQLAPTDVTYRTNLMDPGQSLSPFLVYRYYPDQGVKPEHPLGQAQAAIIAFSAIWLVLGRRRLGQVPLVAIGGGFALATAALSLFLMLNLSQPLWDGVRFLAYLQFPWRLQAILAMAAALLAGAVAAYPWPFLFLSKQGWRWLRLGVGLGFIVLVAGTSLPEVPHGQMSYPLSTRPLLESDATRQGMADYDGLQILEGKEWKIGWIMEFLPKWVTSPRDELGSPRETPRTDSAPLNNATAIALLAAAPLRPEFAIEAPAGFPLRLHSLYFPGWQATIDGRPVTAYPSSDLGLVTVDVPKGDHIVALSFEDSPIRGAAGAASLVFGLALVLGMLLVWRRRPLVIALVLLPLILLVGGAAWWPRPALTPVPVDVNLANKAKLVGYRMEEMDPGKARLDLTLYWLGLASFDEDYKVFVHLLTEDDTGRLSQHDSQPVFNYSPTTRWEVGEVVPDRHTLDLTGVPPGRYKVYVGMYSQVTGRNLTIVNSDGSERDGRLLLAEVSLPKLP